MSLQLDHVSSSRTAHAATDEYEGTINGKAFSVLICTTDGPNWCASPLDDDEKDTVLAAIESLVG